jgi:molybdopterin converting factor small subunit
MSMSPELHRRTIESVVRIELYGLARHRADVAAIDVEAANLGTALAGLAAACPRLVPEVVDGTALSAGYLASLNGERFIADACHPLAAGDTLIILGAEAGG